MATFLSASGPFAIPSSTLNYTTLVTTNGPFEYGGWLFGVWWQGAPGAPRPWSMVMMGSDDGGHTWSAQDTEPIFDTYPAANSEPEAEGILGAFQSGSTIWVVAVSTIAEDGGGNLKLCPFDCTSRTFQSPILGGPNVYTAFTESVGLCLAVRSNGDAVVARYSKHGTGANAAVFDVWNGTAWIGPTIIGGFIPTGCTIDSSGTVHVFGIRYTTGPDGEVMYASISPSNVPAVPATVADDRAGIYQFVGFPNVYVTGGVETVGLLYARGIRYLPSAQLESVRAHFSELSCAVGSFPMTFTPQECAYRNNATSRDSQLLERHNLLSYNGQKVALWTSPDSYNYSLYYCLENAGQWLNPVRIHNVVQHSPQFGFQWVQARTLSSSIGIFATIVDNSGGSGIYYFSLT